MLTVTLSALHIGVALLLPVAVLQGVIIVHLLRRPQRKKKTSKTNQTRYAITGDSNVQGKDITVHHHHGSQELLYFAQAKDLQKTVDSLLQQISDLSQVKLRLMNRVEQLAEENTGLWNELLTVRAERPGFRFPMFPFPISNEKAA